MRRIVQLGALLLVLASSAGMLAWTRPVAPLAGSSASTWYAEVGPAGLAAAVMWSAGVLLAAWLSAATAAQVLTSLPRLARLRPWADAISPRSLRWLGQGLAGLSLTAGLATATAGPAVAQSPPPLEQVTETTSTLVTASAADLVPARATAGGAGTAVMRPLDLESADEGSPTTHEAGRATMRPLDDGLPAAGPARPVSVPVPVPVAPTPVDEPAPPAVEVDPAEPGLAPAGGGAPGRAPSDLRSTPAPASPDTVVVSPGDSFWSIAELQVAGPTGGAVADELVAPYWRRLVAANLDLVVDPDLIHPGQVLRLPQQ